MTSPTLAASSIDIAIGTATLWGEARGEPPEGQDGVAWVIRTRAEASGLAVAEICLRPEWFSCWNDDWRRNLLAAHHDADVFQRLRDRFVAVLDGSTPDPTGSADHYLNLALARPSWFRPDRVTVVLGGHTFLRLLDIPRLA